MEYTINKLGAIAGISTRTLRYYDEIGLLEPLRVNSSGYRIYGQREVDLLQQIMLYREMGVSLEDIKKLITASDFDRAKALERHLTALLDKRLKIDTLIQNVKKTISASKGEINMSDKEKFEGFKQKMLDDNEAKYGKEIRAKYGDSTVEASYEKIKGMTKEQYDEVEKLSVELNETLAKAFEIGDPGGEMAQKACELHKKWLCYFYPNYSPEYHMGLGETYVNDERFTAYYDKIAAGCAPFLRDAIKIYCS